MKMYILMVATAIVLLSLFGVILPMLLSAKSTEAVLLGGLIVIILPVIAAGAFKLFNGEAK